ncbi:MAG: putative transposase [Bacillota bacterium]|nr:MAG: putative transposase [Bacillota bacterium]
MECFFLAYVAVLRDNEWRVQTVTIKVRDNKDNQKRKTLSLQLQETEFVRRFLMHVLPSRFVKVRYYGILATRNKKTKLALCRRLTSSALYKPRFEGLSTLQVLTILLGRDVAKCPKCQKDLRTFCTIRASPSITN